MTVLLCVVFFLSGFSALLFESLWFRGAGLALGNSVWASSLVLASFMGGLALGNALASRFGARVKRPITLYALLELIIGTTGLILVCALPNIPRWLTPAFRPFLDSLWVLNLLRFKTAFICLMIPSTAMGMTLPLLVDAMTRRDSHFGRSLGRLYGWNTLGGMIGAVAGELTLIGWFGIRGTGVVAALVNGLAALLALSFATQSDAGPVSSKSSMVSAKLSGTSCRLLAAAFVAGAIALALEVVWFRLLVFFVNATSLVFAMMLGTILAGIGLGGLIASRWLAAAENADGELPFVALAAGLACIASYRTLGPVLHSFETSSVPWHDVLMVSATLMFAVSALSGVLFTLLGAAIGREVIVAARAAGLLAFANTIGATVGALIAPFVLLPTLGVEQSIRWLASSYGLVAVLTSGDIARSSKWKSPRYVLPVTAGLFVITCLLFPSGILWRDFFVPKAAWVRSLLDAKPVAMREGPTTTVIYFRNELLGEPVDYQLFTDGFLMSDTSTLSYRYTKLFAYLPEAVHPHLSHALLIGYGVGGTAKALTNTRELETIDVVDISPEVLQMGRTVYPQPHEFPLDDPRVTVHLEDGRYFLQTTDRRYDIITSEPPPPKNAGVVNLYTREYFSLMRDRLADGGLVTYWLPVHLLYENEAKAIAHAFCDVFPDCSLWAVSNLQWMLMGTREAVGPVSEARFTQQWHDPRVSQDLEAMGFEVPEQLGALFLADADDLRSIVQNVPPVTDDHPKLISNTFPGAADERGFFSWMDVRVTRERFSRSPIIHRLWPESLRTASLTYFESEGQLDALLFERPNDAAAALPLLHRFLAGPPLKFPILWLLRSNPSVQRVARSAIEHGLDDPLLDYHVAAQAMAQRNFLGAAARWRRALERGTAGRSDPRPLILYALCRGGETVQAAELMARWYPPSTDSHIDPRVRQFFSSNSELSACVSSS